MTDVTVVVSTYNRPHALVAALGGVKWQTLAPKAVLVIGDCCGPETGEALKEVTGLPLTYINLESRFGEQAGPNSVGAALAETRYIAFLNHDDLWLPDHLERAIATMKRRRAHFHTARAAFATADGSRDNRAAFYGISPPKRRLAQAFSAPFYLFEPVSAWVMTRRASRRLKRWNPAATLWRPPLADWILRAWRAGLRYADGETITVLKHSVYTIEDRRSKLLYDVPTGALDDWAVRIAAEGPDAFRAHVIQETADSIERGIRLDFDTLFGPEAMVREASAALTPANARRFWWTGRDAMQSACERAGLEPGWQLKAALKRRTGEHLPPPPDLDAAIAFAAARLAQGKPS
jgi:glycosyltransferase involved in cell wall biosynthesis